MSSLFDDVKRYGTKWQLVKTESFSEEDLRSITRAEVVNGDYGLNACFTITSPNGQSEMAFIPMSKDANVVEGEILDLTKATVSILTKDGDYIKRVNY